MVTQSLARTSIRARVATQASALASCCASGATLVRCSCDSSSLLLRDRTASRYSSQASWVLRAAQGPGEMCGGTVRKEAAAWPTRPDHRLMPSPENGTQMPAMSC